MPCTSHAVPNALVLDRLRRAARRAIQQLELLLHLELGAAGCQPEPLVEYCGVRRLLKRPKQPRGAR